MTYLLISREFPPQDGGIAAVTYELAKSLRQKGEEVVVLTWRYPAGKWPMKFDDKAQPFPIIRMPVLPTRWLQIAMLFWGAVLIHFRKPIKRIIATSWNFSGVVTALLFHFWHIPYLVIVHGYEVSREALSKSDLMLMRFALKHARRISAVSEFTRQKLLEVYSQEQQKVRVIRNGVNVTTFKPSKNREALRQKWGVNNKKVLITVARLFARKGHDRVLDVLPSIIKKIPEAYYLIVGAGPERMILEKKVHDLNLQNHVKFTGFISADELPELYAASDLFVLPNREIKVGEAWAGDFEGFGISFVEASAVGLPVIAGKSGGAADAVKENKTGILVPPDDLTALEQAIVRLLTDANFSGKMGQAGREWVESELNWKKISAEYENSF